MVALSLRLRFRKAVGNFPWIPVPHQRDDPVSLGLDPLYRRWQPVGEAWLESEQVIEHTDRVDTHKLGGADIPENQSDMLGILNPVPE